ncbi:hypothetical protein SDRG_01702 [Saprolegnia diclina VS20]|uniref:Translin n=1 Tax=Saprolegnia diclina (strain VS20) TaxID=1156394 RepID=T0QR62_SAPDV|nr:hypothetical protein SDRG_01702 [Saprolegnia diclina VS20]EQC40619.1 hypothetical protein SDRG_01702 [Saprolegnia diclina VS20]|eukprot:XP_008605463.1 hypothetical protein SDRG_01702 [Saprolegnia diclina VS20]
MAEPKAVLDQSSFQRMSADMEAYDEKREIVIKHSRDILKSSKQAIFAMHRGNMDEASEKLEVADQVIQQLAPLIMEEPTLRHGSFSSAMEEYAEAQCFRHFLTAGTLVALEELNFVDRDEYLGGVVDFTGEVTRYAVVMATKRDVARVEECRNIVDAISGELIQFSFRNSPLRKKYDSLKYNLKKLEHTLYELSLVGPLRAFNLSAGDDEPSAENDTSHC